MKTAEAVGNVAKIEFLAFPMDVGRWPAFRDVRISFEDMMSLNGSKDLTQSVLNLIFTHAQNMPGVIPSQIPCPSASAGDVIHWYMVPFLILEEGFFCMSAAEYYSYIEMSHTDRYSWRARILDERRLIKSLESACDFEPFVTSCPRCQKDLPQLESDLKSEKSLVDYDLDGGSRTGVNSVWPVSQPRYREGVCCHCCETKLLDRDDLCPDCRW